MIMVLYSHHVEMFKQSVSLQKAMVIWYCSMKDISKM